MPCGAAKDSGQNAENGHCPFEDLDHSVLQQPLNLGVTNVKQILKCIQSGSREVKDIILNECNIIYECKVCVGLFRSLANFMYHKRCYCKKHLCEEMVLFENFEEESPKVIIQPEPTNESGGHEKISEENKNGPKIVECTVNLVKTDLTAEKVSLVKNDIIKPALETASMSKEEEKTPPTTANKGKAKTASDVKKVSDVEKIENPMISRRTRDKNTQNAHAPDSSKTALKTPLHDEPPVKSAKVILKETQADKTSSAETNNSSVNTNSNKDAKSDTMKCTTVTEKSTQSFPKIIFKTIDGNPHAVFQSTEKIKSENVNIKTKFENSAIQTKVDNEKLIIVLKKDVKIPNNPVPKPAVPDKQNKDLEKQNEFHLTRRKRLMTRNDCNVHELKCLVCKTQFMSLKTLYFHMLSLHSKKRLYYPCPFCKTLFVQMYGVTRHLVSIHNKTKEQINKLREVIKKKSVWKRVDDVNPSNETFQNPLNSESYGLKQENKVETLKINKSECEPPIKTIIKIGKNVTLHKCSKCNRVFGRKSSQVSHEKFCIMNAIKVETVDVPAPQPTSPPPVVSFLSLSPKQPIMEPLNKLIQPPKQLISDLKMNVRPKRGAEKQMHKDFVNSQTLKWRSVNRVDTHAKSLQSNKKSSGKNLEKKVLSIMNAESLLCLKCDKKFSSYSNLRRHVAIHVGWTRFKCKFCDYQAYNKSQCWTHVQKTHSVSDSDMEKSIVNLVSNNSCGKKSVTQSVKRSPDANMKTSPCKSNTIPKMKISKKKNVNISIKNISSDKKNCNVSKKDSVENKKDLHDSKKDAHDKTVQDTKKDTDSKKDISDRKENEKESKKDKNLLPTHIQKCNVPEYKKETTNYKSVTTSNPTTIILSKKIPSSAVQSIVTISSVSSTSPNKSSSVRSSPRKNEPKVAGEKTITSLVTRSSAYMKGSSIQIKLPARSSSIDEMKKDPNSSDKTYGKKERLISEWFPKKDLTSNNTRRDSAPLIIGLVPASSSGLNVRTKNPGITFERNSS